MRKLLVVNRLFVTPKVQIFLYLAWTGRCPFPEDGCRFPFLVLGQGRNIHQVFHDFFLEQNRGALMIHGIRVLVMVFFDFLVTPRIVVQRPKKGVIISIIADNFFIVNAVPKRDDAVDDLPEFIGIELLFPSQKLGVV